MTTRAGTWRSAEFFVDDSSFTSDGGRLAANAQLRVRFDTAVKETEQMVDGDRPARA